MELRFIKLGMLNETIYSAGKMIGVDERGPKVREITFLALLDECDCLTNNDGTRIPQREIDEIRELCISWWYVNEEIEIVQIHNNETGEVYWEHNDLPENRMWTTNDEKLYSSILMWGELE